MEDLNALMKMMGKPTPMERLINFIDDAIDEVMEKLENNKYGFNEEQVWKLIKKSKFYDEDIYKEILKERCITFLKELKTNIKDESYKKKYLDTPDKIMKMRTAIDNLLGRDITWIDEVSFHKIFKKGYKTPKGLKKLMLKKLEDSQN